MTKFKLPIRPPEQINPAHILYTPECLADAMKDFSEDPVMIFDSPARNVLVAVGRTIETDENGFSYMNIEVTDSNIATQLKEVVDKICVRMFGDGIIRNDTQKIHSFKLHFGILQYA